MDLLLGNCLERLKELPDNSVDSIVTDPPYGLKFMNKKWDHSVPSVEIWKEAYRVLKHGGHLLSFGGTRTYHRMVVNIEDAGFEIRDQIQWLYGSGFPKSHNISKAIDKKLYSPQKTTYKPNMKNNNYGKAMGGGKTDTTTKPNSDLAKQWDGFGTALKPANEPICLARKPLSEKTIVDNVLKWGTGGLNIDGCRVELRMGDKKGEGGDLTKSKIGSDSTFNLNNGDFDRKNFSQGRFPANLILDEEAGEMLDEQSGILKQGTAGKKSRPFGDGRIFGTASQFKPNNSETYNCSTPSGASRFFYCAKASKSERNEGLEGMSVSGTYSMEKMTPMRDKREQTFNQNNHPTVKPIKLMSYLCRLITPPNGTVLDPFMGSGSTGVAAIKEGFEFIGIEMNEDYLEIARNRINRYRNE